MTIKNSKPFRSRPAQFVADSLRQAGVASLVFDIANNRIERLLGDGRRYFVSDLDKASISVERGACTRYVANGKAQLLVNESQEKWIEKQCKITFSFSWKTHKFVTRFSVV